MFAVCLCISPQRGKTPLGNATEIGLTSVVDILEKKGAVSVDTAAELVFAAEEAVKEAKILADKKAKAAEKAAEKAKAIHDIFIESSGLKVYASLLLL